MVEENEEQKAPVDDCRCHLRCLLNWVHHLLTPYTQFSRHLKRLDFENLTHLPVPPPLFGGIMLHHHSVPLRVFDVCTSSTLSTTRCMISVISNKIIFLVISKNIVVLKMSTSS